MHSSAYLIVQTQSISQNFYAVNLLTILCKSDLSGAPL